MIFHTSSMFLIENENVWIWWKLWTGRSEFPVGEFALFAYTLPREKFVSFSHKYQETVEFWVHVNLLHIKQLNTAFGTTTFIMILQHFLKKFLVGNVLKRELNKIGPAWWKIPFHSTHEHFGNSNRNFWSNGTRPCTRLLQLATSLSPGPPRT